MSITAFVGMLLSIYDHQRVELFKQESRIVADLPSSSLKSTSSSSIIKFNIVVLSDFGRHNASLHKVLFNFGGGVVFG